MDTIKISTYFVLLFSLIVCCFGQYTREQILRNTNKMRKLPGPNVCGKVSNSFGIKIINGEPANLGDYPWMVNLGYREPGKSEIKWWCAGSLITEQYVITAAHCMAPALIRPFVLVTVRVGELDLDPNIADGANPMDYEIEKATFHPDYNDNRKIHDIGLIKLKGRVTFSDNVGPICTPTQEFSTNTFLGHVQTIAGWGKSVLGSNKPSTRLLKAEVQVQDTEVCRTNVTSVYKLRNAVIGDNVVCASAPGKDTCQGDSGGPLMMYRKMNNTPGNIYLMGIVSYGHRCAVEGYPGVYTRVIMYMPWIIDNMDI